MFAEWEQFLEDVQQARNELGDPSTVWYRGHSNASWPLIPSLLRIKHGLQNEQALFQEFKRSATRLFAKRDSDWELLFDMQHYGIPTRLLDWSEILGVSVAFILHTDYGADQDSALFVLNPAALNESSGINEIKSLPDDGEFDYKSIYWHKRPFAALHPIAVRPPLQSERLFAQRGVFTIHGNSTAALEKQCPLAIRKVTLPAVAKSGARRFLEYANLDEYAIYPDILGMSRHIVRKILSA